MLCVCVSIYIYIYIYIYEIGAIEKTIFCNGIGFTLLAGRRVMVKSGNAGMKGHDKTYRHTGNTGKTVSACGGRRPVAG